MKKIYLSFAAHCHLSDLEKYSDEKFYEKALTKIIQFLYTHPKISFSFYIPASYIDWLSEAHNEFLIVLKDLTNRKQLEILGGGYYEPIFPLITPLDRIGQIEATSTVIRKKIGKRIHGVFLGDSIWDTNLISSFKSCGIDYAIVHNKLINESERSGKVFIVEDIGKTLNIIPYYDFSEEAYKDENILEPQEFLEKITKSLFYAENSQENSEQEKFIYFTSINFWDLIKLIDSNWLETFFELAIKSPIFDFSCPASYINSENNFIRTFISGTCPPKIKKWAVIPFVSMNEDEKLKNANIRNFVYNCQEVQYLYSRVMYSETIASQCKGDKNRKSSVREFIWKAQRQDLYWFLGDAGICNPKNRFEAYKNLICAEKIVRETSPTVANSFISFDYDMDGRKEYIVHRNDYNAFISQCGGLIFELDLMSNAKNYCDTMRRIPFYDGVMDVYPKKLFLLVNLIYILQQYFLLHHFLSFDFFENIT